MDIFKLRIKKEFQPHLSGKKKKNLLAFKKGNFNNNKIALRTLYFHRNLQGQVYRCI